MSALVWHDEWCELCGVNPAIGRLCSSCQADEDFYNCEFCHGTSCTQECEDEDVT
jgi:hypothetical protein